MKRGGQKQIEEAPTGFNLQVTYRDEQTGLIDRHDPYILRVCGDGGNRTQLFERPKGSGNCFDKQNNPIGRWVNGKHQPTAEHIKFVPPMNEDQKIRAEMTKDKVRIAELEKELKAVAAEKEKTAAAKKVQGA